MYMYILEEFDTCKLNTEPKRTYCRKSGSEERHDNR